MIFSLILLGALLPHLTLTAYINVGIVNGTESKPHSRPYMVSVQSNKKHTCGGFLVSERFVMTAAHCFRQGQSLTVVVGAHDLRQSHDRIAVKFYHIYPGYDSTSLQNDIMLLQLSRTTLNGKNVKPISIRKKKWTTDAKKTCSVAGWGRTTTNGNPTDRLMEADVKVIDSKSCEKYWGKISGMVCAMGHGGFCQGDSGGPLVCENTAIGVVSFNEENNCDKPTKPNVYTKISSFLPWIKAILDGVKIEHEQ